MNPLIYAHRGAQTFALENSMEAFEKAFQLGADGIELDVRLCKSGEIVVIHDFFLKRLTGTSGVAQIVKPAGDASRVPHPFRRKGWGQQIP